jgi:hypothetical protein
MSTISIVSTDVLQGIISRHPEITPESIPSSGIEVIEGSNAYLVYIHNGSIGALNITAYQNGSPIDINKAINDASLIGATASTAQDLGQSLLDLGQSLLPIAIILIAWLIYREAKK